MDAPESQPDAFLRPAAPDHATSEARGHRSITNAAFDEVPGWDYTDTPEDFEHNVDLLARAEYEWVKEEAAQRELNIENLKLDAASDTISRDSEVRPLSKAAFGKIVSGLDAGRSGIGETTLSRALVTQATLRGDDGRPGGGHGGQLDRAIPGDGQAEGSGRGLFRITQRSELFYSRTRALQEAEGGTGSQGSRSLRDIAGERARDIASDAARRLDRHLPGIISDRLTLAANAKALLASDYAARHPFTEKEIAQMQGAEGCFDHRTGQSIVFTDQVHVRESEGEAPHAAIARVILHERVGHDGLTALLKDSAFKELEYSQPPSA